MRGGEGRKREVEQVNPEHFPTGMDGGRERWIGGWYLFKTAVKYR